jgi:molecular chaperone DnaK
MVREAEKNAAADAEKRELIESINKAELVLHDTEANVDEFGSQLNQVGGRQARGGRLLMVAAVKVRLIFLQVDGLKEKMGEFRQKLTKRDALKAAEVREMVSKLQKDSIKVFEVAYTKRAAQQGC